MAELLHSLHAAEYPLLCRADHKWPIAFWSNCHRGSGDIDSLLGILNSSFNADTELADGNHLQRVHSASGGYLYNGTTFVLERAYQADDGLSLHCGLGTYFDALMTCDSLAAELTRACSNGVPTNTQTLLRSCPKRRAFLSRCPDPAFSGKGRSAAIGVSTLVACRLEERYYGLLGVRSDTVATDPGRSHVIPSGMFSADTDDPVSEFSLLHTFFREYQEELFEDSDLRTPGRESPYDWFYSRPPLQYLRQLLNRGSASLQVSGYALNLINYRPEVLLLLVVDDQDWLSQPLGTHVEFTGMRSGDNGERALIVPVDITAPAEELLAALDDLGCDMAPPAAAALWKGRDTLKHILNRTALDDESDAQS